MSVMKGEGETLEAVSSGPVVITFHYTDNRYGKKGAKKTNKRKQSY